MEIPTYSLTQSPPPNRVSTPGLKYVCLNQDKIFLLNIKAYINIYMSIAPIHLVTKTETKGENYHHI